MNDSELRTWLRNYGHHRPLGIRGPDVDVVGLDSLAKMVRSAQAALGLVVDGWTGPKTQTAMALPRCGCPDHFALDSARVPAFGQACRLGVGVYTDWSGIKGRSEASAQDTMRAAFTKVNKYNLRFHVVEDKADALVNIYMGPAAPGVLAWMQVGDGCGWTHDSLYNIDVDWSDDLLFAGTVLHELIGHGAGVGHLRSGIMAPTFDPNVPAEVDELFAAELEKRYGLSDGNNPIKPTGEKMDIAAIIALVLPYIIKCLEEGASQERIRASLRNPSNRQRRRLTISFRKHVRATEPDMRRRDRKVRADALLDSAIARAQESTDERLSEIIDQAQRQRAVQV